MKTKHAVAPLILAAVLLLSENLAVIEPPAASSVEAVGEPELVFDYSTMRCETMDIPDAPARAFRDAQGQANLIDSHYTSYRMIGDSLDTVRRDCRRIMNSRQDPEFNNFAYYEWLTAPYTTDGLTVYSLVHNEWYGYLVDDRCRRESPGDGWVNAITMAVSADGGANFTHPADYIVAKPSVPWDRSFPCRSDNFTRYGQFNPSNIVKKDDYYYAMFQSERDPKGVYDWGTCLMRAAKLGEAAAWEIWTADSGWNDSPAAPCAPIARDTIEKMHESLTYNTYLGAYVLVGAKFALPEPGVYYSTSTDLFHWSQPVKIMSGDNIAYPSLLDPQSPSRNFETTGQEAYLYYTRFNQGGSYLDRDLLRQKIRFALPGGRPDGYLVGRIKESDSGKFIGASSAPGCINQFRAGGIAVEYSGPAAAGSALPDQCNPEPFYQTNLPPGTYAVSVSVPAGWQVVGDNEREVSVKSDRYSHQWFSVREIKKPAPSDDAEFITQYVPAQMAAGQTYYATVTMKNSGGTTWTAGQYFLAPQTAYDWGQPRVNLAGDVAAGQEKTFVFPVTAPAVAAGAHDFQWRMANTDAGAFGQTTPNTSITVLKTKSRRRIWNWLF